MTDAEMAKGPGLVNAPGRSEGVDGRRRSARAGQGVARRHDAARADGPEIRVPRHLAIGLGPCRVGDVAHRVAARVRDDDEAAVADHHLARHDGSGGGAQGAAGCLDVARGELSDGPTSKPARRSCGGRWGHRRWRARPSRPRGRRPRRGLRKWLWRHLHVLLARLPPTVSLTEENGERGARRGRKRGGPRESPQAASAAPAKNEAADRAEGEDGRPGGKPKPTHVQAVSADPIHPVGREPLRRRALSECWGASGGRLHRDEAVRRVARGRSSPRGVDPMLEILAAFGQARIMTTVSIRRRAAGSPTTASREPAPGGLSRRLPLRHGRARRPCIFEAWARARGRAFLRFDYSGHGASSGAFEDGCIGDWAEDAAAAILALTKGPGARRLVDGRLIACLFARAHPTASPRWSASPPRRISPRTASGKASSDADATKTDDRRAHCAAVGLR